MRTFERAVAQGELYITRIDALPDGVIPVPPEGGRVVVGHSETGHHHVMTMERTNMYRHPTDLMQLFLLVKIPDQLEHLRPYDTHEPIGFTVGTYGVRRQREYTPQGWRRAAD